MAYSARLFQCQKTKTIRGFVLPAATTLRPKRRRGRQHFRVPRRPAEVGQWRSNKGRQVVITDGYGGGSNAKSPAKCYALLRGPDRKGANPSGTTNPRAGVALSSIGDDAGLTSMKADLDRRREPLTMKVIIGDDRGQSSTPTMWGGRLLRPAAHTANQWTSRKLRRECRECPDMAHSNLDRTSASGSEAEIQTATLPSCLSRLSSRCSS
jgi:hypothetical protein